MEVSPSLREKPERNGGGVPGRGLEAGVSKIDGLVCRVTESRSGGNKRDLRNWLPHFSLSHFREAICETGTSPRPVP